MSNKTLNIGSSTNPVSLNVNGDYKINSNPLFKTVTEKDFNANEASNDTIYFIEDGSIVNNNYNTMPIIVNGVSNTIEGFASTVDKLVTANTDILTQTTNLNTFFTPGDHVVGSSGWATLDKNYPQKSLGGYLNVKELIKDRIYVQTYYGFSGSSNYVDQWQRHYYRDPDEATGKWYRWTRLYNEHSKYELDKIIYGTLFEATLKAQQNRNTNTYSIPIPAVTSTSHGVCLASITIGPGTYIGFGHAYIGFPTNVTPSPSDLCTIGLVGSKDATLGNISSIGFNAVQRHSANLSDFTVYNIFSTTSSKTLYLKVGCSKENLLQYNGGSCEIIFVKLADYIA